MGSSKTNKGEKKDRKQPPDISLAILDHVAGLLLGSVLTFGETADGFYPPSVDLQVCLRTFRYCPLLQNEFQYESGKDPVLHLRPQRRRDFAWRQTTALSRLVQAHEKKGLPFHTPMTQLLHHKEMYKGSEDSIPGIWDRSFRGSMPMSDDPRFEFWPVRSAAACAVALIKYLSIFGEAPMETLMQYAPLITYWSGVVADEMSLNLPSSIHAPCKQLALLLTQSIIAMVCGNYQMLPPPEHPKNADEHGHAMIYRASLGRNITRSEMASIPYGKELLGEIIGLMGLTLRA